MTTTRLSPSSRPVLTILSLWRRRLPGLAFGVLASVASLLAGLALLALSGLRLAGTGAGLVLASALLLRLLGAGRVLLRYGERLATHDAMFRALADLRVWFFRRLARTAAGGIGFRRSGDLLSRLVGDVEALDGLYLRVIVPLAGAVLAFPLLFLLALRQGLSLALVVAALFAVSVFVLPVLAARMVRGDAALLSERASDLRVSVLDLVGGLREIRAFNAEGRMLAGVRSAEQALLSLQRVLARNASVAGAATFLCQQATVLALLAALAGLAFKPIQPVGGALLLFALLAAFELASGLARAGVLAGHMRHAAARVVQAGEFPPTPAAAASPTATPAAVIPKGHALRLRDVSFRWQPERPPVFEHLSLDIPQGARVAILGPSGSGKSSLAALLLRVAVPQAGHINLGGVDLASMDESVLRSRIAWLSQSTHLFADTVRANLLLGRPDATDAQLWSALDQAGIADTVRALPDSLDSWLGEGGTGLSGGQARRVALARTLLSPAPILILDEPATGLDAEAEQNFLLTLNEAVSGRTVILIAHRLTGVERLDRIWRLAGGHASAAAA